MSLSEDDEVGIYVGDFEARGRGIATAAIMWLCCRFDSRTPLFAEVDEENEASRRLFERCGFRRASSESGWLKYVYEAP